MNVALNFGVKRSKFKVVVESNMLETSRGVATRVYRYLYPPPQKKEKSAQVNFFMG